MSNYLSREFMRAVRSGNATEVDNLINDPRHGDVSVAMWSAGYRDAIHYKHIGVVKALLDNKIPVEDALLHAVESLNIEAVTEIILRTEQLLMSDDYPTLHRDRDIVNQFAVSHNFPAYSTPLLLATRRDHLEIVQLLMDHGASMPSVDETLSRVRDDSLERALARLEWYQSMTSEVYILLTSDDPIETALAWGENIQKKMTRVRPSLIPHYEAIHTRLEMLLAKLIDCTSCKDEIWEALNERKAADGSRISMTKRGVSSDPMERLRRVVKLRYKKVISHGYCQEYMLEWWYGMGALNWTFQGHSRNTFQRFVSVLLIVMMSPLICLLNIILPEDVKFVRWFDKLMRTPFVIHILHTTSLFGLVFLLFIVSFNIAYVPVECPDDVSFRYNPQGYGCIEFIYSGSQLGFRNLAIFIWVIALTWHHIRILYTQGLRLYTNYSWHFVDYLSIILYWSYISLHGSTMLCENCSEYRYTTVNGTRVLETIAHAKDWGWSGYLHFQNTKYEVSRRAWDTFDPKLISEVCFAVANILSVLRILHATVAFQLVGPLQISFGAILIDVVKFACLYVFVLVAFALGMTEIYSTYAAEYNMECANDPTSAACGAMSFESIAESCFNLFWTGLGDIDYGSLFLPDNLWLTYRIGLFIYAVYVVVVVLIMINALIAMLSNTYSRVEENARMEWHFSRTIMMLEYDKLYGWLPPPMNIIPRVGWVAQQLIRLCTRVYVIITKRSLDNTMFEISMRRQRATKRRVGRSRRSVGKILADRLLQYKLSCPERSEKLQYY